ncbi:hypothetical protein V6N12_056526 [Hibiscus sabdariffa]|uniref:Uncharacterized protein n=1 Tax=Hibiscus sabdariffa TaxID=183260 RepID=A0ABR2CSS2_9ROSI
MSGVNECQWKAEEAIGGNAKALQSLRELIVFPILYSHEAKKLGLKWPRDKLGTCNCSRIGCPFNCSQSTFCSQISCRRK